VPAGLVPIDVAFPFEMHLNVSYESHFNEGGEHRFQCYKVNLPRVSIETSGLVPLQICVFSEIAMQVITNIALSQSIYFLSCSVRSPIVLFNLIPILELLGDLVLISHSQKWLDKVKRKPESVEYIE
jgi:hypothetical protein